MSTRSGSHKLDAMSPGVKITAGVAVFVVCSIIQAMGDSSMFDPTFLDPGGIRGLLVVVTFWPGWMLIGGFIGTGLYEIFGPNED